MEGICAVVCKESLSRVWFFVTPRTIACQAPLSMEFPRQEHWSGLPFPSPGDLPDPGIEPTSPTLVCMLSRSSCVWLLATPWPVTCHAPLSMEFPRQESWKRLPFPSPGDLPDPGIELQSPALQADTLPSEPPGKLWPSNSTSGHISWEHHNSKRHMQPSVHCNTIYNSQDMEAT